MKPNIQWRQVWLVALFITAITTIPYLVGASIAGDDWLFNGFTFGVDDGNAYLGKMRIGAEGDWDFYLFYSPEQTKSEFGLYLPYILIGQWVHVVINPAPTAMASSLIGAFQLFRIIASMILLVVTYRFIAEFLRSPWLAFILAVLGGGLGWLLIFTGAPPVDYYIPEGFSFLLLYGLPHIALARAAMLLGFIALFIALRRNSWRYVIISGICWNIVGLMVTFYLAVLYAVLGAWGIVLWLRKRQFPMQFARLGITATVLTFPLFFYNFYLFQQNPAFEQWSSQNDLPSPNPIHYVFGYGVLAIFAGIGSRWAWHKAQNDDRYGLLIGWIIIAPFLVYLPINVQRRLSEGVIMPLAILGVVGMKLSAKRLFKMRYTRLRLIVLGLLLIGTLLFWTFSLLNLMKPAAPLYRERAELEAFDWLIDHAADDEVVLGSLRTGNFLPIYTHLRPFYGHGPETLYSEEKADLVKAFYEGQLSISAQEQLFADYHIRYVMLGEHEITAFQVDPSQWSDKLKIVYQNTGYVLYQVEPQ